METSRRVSAHIPVTEVVGLAGAGFRSPFAGDTLDEVLGAFREILENSPELQFEVDGVKHNASMHLCLLDIVFEIRDAVTGLAVGKSGYAARSEDAIRGYIGSLAQYLERGSSVAAHPWFEAGLPCENANIRIPGRPTKPPTKLTQATLTAFMGRLKRRSSQHGLSWGHADSLVVDGVLRMERGDGKRGKPDATAKSLEYYAPRPFTDKSLTEKLNRQAAGFKLDGQFSDPNLHELWNDFCEIVFADENLLSPSGLPAQQVIALPFGYRDPKDPEQFNLVAKLFLATDYMLCDKDRLETMLRTIALYLYRTSAPLIAHQAALGTARGAWSHEIKHLGSALKGSWIKPMRDMFEIEGETLPEAGAPRGKRVKLGKVILTPEAAQCADLLKVSWYGRPLAAAADYLSFSAALDDVDRYVPPAGSDIIENAARLALSSLMPKAYSQKALHAADILDDRLWDLAVESYAAVVIKQIASSVGGVKVDKLVTLPWLEGSPGSDVLSMGRFTGVLAAVLRNVFQHANVRRPVRIDVTADADHVRIQVGNAIPVDALGFEQAAAQWEYLLEFEDLLDADMPKKDRERLMEQLVEIETTLQKAVSTKSRFDTKSDDVILFYLRDYSASVETPPQRAFDEFVKVVQFRTRRPAAQTL